MAILDELNARYKQAMKAREQQAVDTIRMVRARLDTRQKTHLRIYFRFCIFQHLFRSVYR